MNWKTLLISFLENFRKISENPLERLIEIGLKEGMTFADIGCTLGFYSFAASQIVGEKGQVYAVDINPDFIAYIAKKTEKRGIKNIKAMVANAQEIALPSESVNIVFLHLVLHDIKDKTAAIKEFYRILKKNGKLVIDEENVMVLDVIRKLAEDSGFKFCKRLRKTIQIFEKQRT
ncbi:MAG: class I SAM-dependent methyltransferase [Candidatus Bathycorpusculaceae bacterium]